MILNLGFAWYKKGFLIVLMLDSSCNLSFIKIFCQAEYNNILLIFLKKWRKPNLIEKSDEAVKERRRIMGAGEHIAHRGFVSLKRWKNEACKIQVIHSRDAGGFKLYSFDSYASHLWED